jgi:hypothetical protein
MTAQYRIVYLMTDPFRGDRVALGVLAEDVGFIERPGVLETLHDPVMTSLARSVLVDLREASLPELPLTVGPYVMGAPIQRAPSGVTDMNAWVRAAYFPEGVSKRAMAPRIQRVREGYRFFETRDVHRIVKGRFRLDTNPLLDPVSQYVTRDTETLLLEPISMSRPNAHVEVKHVAQVFAAYGAVLGTETTAHTRIAYFLAGGEARKRAETMEQLSQYAVVVDTAVPRQADELIERMRSAGRDAMTTLS